MEIIDTDSRIIEHALDSICDQKKTIWNKEGEPGYIIDKNGLFLFQPFKIKDTNVPYFYRERKHEKGDDKGMIEDPFTPIKVEFKDNFSCDSTYNEVYQNLRDKFLNLNDDIEKYSWINELKKEHLKDHYIDKLPFEEKKSY